MRKKFLHKGRELQGRSVHRVTEDGGMERASQRRGGRQRVSGKCPPDFIP